MADFLGIPIRCIKLRSRYWKLWFKFYWYKYIRRLDIIGFYAGVPVVRTKWLDEDAESPELPEKVRKNLRIENSPSANR